jgi:hypothetical protein
MRLYENDGKDIEKDIGAVLRRVFSDADGLRLLRWLLFKCNFFSVAATPEQQALRNFATILMNELGNVYHIDIEAVIRPAGDENE